MSQSELEQQPEQIFTTALALQNQKKFDEALTEYKKLLDISQTADSTLNAEQISAASHNMALIYLEKKDEGLAAVYNQKSLGLNPGNSAAAKLFEQHKNWSTQPNFNREITWQENLNALGFKFFSFDILLVLLGLFLFMTVKKGLQHLLKKAKFEAGQDSRPKLEISFYVFTFLTVLLTLSVGLKWLDHRKMKALILGTNVKLTTQPGENQAVITDLSQGLTVEVLKTTTVDNKIYVQMKYPGAFSGWIKKEDLELLNRLKWP